MTKKWFIGLLIIILLQSLWGFIIYQNKKKTADINKKIMGNKIIVFSYDDSILNKITDILKKYKEIKIIKKETGEEAAKDLNERYCLDDPLFINNKELLPNSITLGLDTKNIDNNSQLKLLDLFNSFEDKIKLLYNEDKIKMDIKNFNYYKKNKLHINFIMGFLILLTSFFTFFYIHKTDSEYWRIYIRAGGKINKKDKYFYKLLLIFLFIQLLIILTNFIISKLVSLNIFNTTQIFIPSVLLIVGFYFAKFIKRRI